MLLDQVTMMVGQMRNEFCFGDEFGTTQTSRNACSSKELFESEKIVEADRLPLPAHSPMLIWIPSRCSSDHAETLAQVISTLSEKAKFFP